VVVPAKLSIWLDTK